MSAIPHAQHTGWADIFGTPELINQVLVKAAKRLRIERGNDRLGQCELDRLWTCRRVENRSSNIYLLFCHVCGD